MSDELEGAFPGSAEPSLEFGRKLDRYIEERSYTKVGVAKRAGITPQHLNRILKGSGTVTLEVALQLCTACGTSIYDVLVDYAALEQGQRDLAEEVALASGESSAAEALDQIKAIAPTLETLDALRGLLKSVRQPTVELFGSSRSENSALLSRYSDWIGGWLDDVPAEQESDGYSRQRLGQRTTTLAMDSLLELSRRKVQVSGQEVNWPIIPATTGKYLDMLAKVLEIATEEGAGVVFSVTSLLPSQWYEPPQRLADSVARYRESIKSALKAQPNLRMNRLIVMAAETEQGKVDDSLIRAGLLRSSKIAGEQEKIETLTQFLDELHSQRKEAHYLAIDEKWTTSIGGDYVSLDQFTKTFKNAAASLFDLLLVGKFRRGEAVPDWLFGVTGSMNLSEDLVPVGILTEPDLLKYVGSFWFAMYNGAKHWEDLLPPESE